MYKHAYDAPGDARYPRERTQVSAHTGAGDARAYTTDAPPAAAEIGYGARWVSPPANLASLPCTIPLRFGAEAMVDPARVFFAENGKAIDSLFVSLGEMTSPEQLGKGKAR